ncbi:hypothetical protein RM780_14310 [Streptomyces sp. DSM 44917]|uniref:Uncharacterized protein n=1 Tax=Streptomyces boetiae TaxID=3075541 RepID=A0ABU2L9F0_9ACTN|nr:hypothetical protein [Streptomyces sp. DSM 44917]MDT0308127.1 hypothetical protein [Streptomyces sp. DSM 44917]
MAAGSPDRRVNGSYAAGKVLLPPGSGNGVTGAGTRAITEDTTGAPGVSGANVHFGTDVDLLDTDGSGTADLAVGGPGENLVDGLADEGAIWVLRRATTGAPIGAGRLLSAEGFGLPARPRGFGPEFGD